VSAAAGRPVTVAADRLQGWLDRFADRHGTVAWTATGEAVVVTAADGSVADCVVPFPPLPASDRAYGGLVAHALRRRRVGVVLVRRGGYAVGVFDGDRLVASKVGSRHVQGRSAAGGWSQQRFARRREGQARVALAAAADTAAAVLLPQVRQGGLDAVVAGGDRRAVDAVLDDPRLEVLRPLVVEHRIDVPDPRLRVLQQAPELFTAVRIRVVDRARSE
jgi:hypothetical protein